VGYDAAAGTYTVKNASASVTFGAADRQTAGDLDRYSHEAGSVRDELVLSRNLRSADTAVALSYVGFGSWLHDDGSFVQDGAQTHKRQFTYFVFGYPTAANDMPKTGSASYSSSVIASARDLGSGGVRAYDMAGSATFNANFASAQVTTTLKLYIPFTIDSTGEFTGTGAISGNLFNGSFTSNDRYFYEGEFAGGFYGPSAREMGYTFAIRNFDPMRGQGGGGASLIFVDNWIVGAVVGKKAD
jgi:hypothetical protein